MGLLLNLLGADKVAANLKRKREYAPRALKNGAKRIATVQTRAIKSGIKDRTGLLKKSIGNKVKEGRKGRITIIVGARRGFRTVVGSKTGRNKMHGLRQDKKGVGKKVVLKAAKGVKEKDVLNPTRYAHLANKKQRFMERGKAASDGQARQIHADAVREVAKA